MTIITDEHCLAYSSPGHPERPERVGKTLDLLRGPRGGAYHQAALRVVADDAILRAHTAAHLSRIGQPPDIDADTPYHPQIGRLARLAARGAIQAMELAWKGERTFSLMRPPGHHASADRAMGFCYLNNVAIAVLAAHVGGVGKVAVYDFDVHHGNGTEAILLGRPGCAFYSVHQYPAYPGTGLHSQDNCHNYPMPPKSPRQEYRAALMKALNDLERFAPDLIAVSAGFDAYRADPIAQELLEQEDYFWLAQKIRDLGRPVFSVLEGGYSGELPELILAYLQGMNGC